MKKFLIILTLTFMSLPLASGAGILKYQILRPATRPLPKDVETLAFVYRNIQFPADSITYYYKYNDIKMLDTVSYKETVVKAVYEGFCSIVQEQYALDTIPLIVLPQTEGNSERTILPLSWKNVNEICKQNFSDILISLDDVVIFNNYKTWFDGDKYNGIADISSFHTWTVYDPLTENYVLHETNLDSLQSYNTSYDLEELIREKLPDREEIAKVVAFSMGEKLAKLLVPSWENVYREYYDSGNRAMREAARKVKEEKWQEALEIWTLLAKDSSEKNIARAAFNSAIVYERLGKIEEALVAIQKSLDIYQAMGRLQKEEDVAETLQEILQKRRKDLIILQRQQDKK